MSGVGFLIPRCDSLTLRLGRTCSRSRQTSGGNAATATRRDLSAGRQGGQNSGEFCYVRRDAQNSGESCYVRRGSTLLEVGVSMIVLAAASAAAVQALTLVAGQRREADRALVAALEAGNLMERVQALPFSEVTADKLGQWELAPWCRERLPEACVVVQVHEEQEPVAGKRIVLALDWRGRDGQRSPPVRLTAWRYPPQGGRAAAHVAPSLRDGKRVSERLAYVKSTRNRRQTADH